MLPTRFYVCTSSDISQHIHLLSTILEVFSLFVRKLKVKRAYLRFESLYEVTQSMKDVALATGKLPCSMTADVKEVSLDIDFQS